MGGGLESGCVDRVYGAHDFSNIETRAVIRPFFFLQGKAPKEIHAILTRNISLFPSWYQHLCTKGTGYLSQG